jgi:DNA-binding transcriptional regulator YiaG
MKKETARKTSVGTELVQRLKRFSEKLASGESLEQQFTCRTVKLSVNPKKYDDKSVRKTRQKLNASQAIFAQFLGVSVSAVRDWEQGLKPPSGPARRLMDEINRNPAYFKERLAQLTSVT